MNPNEQLIYKFYTAFAKADTKTMCECYHNDIQFQDPVFGILKGDDVNQMWKMLIEKSKGNIKIEFSNIKANEYLGSAKWVATYNFSKTNRKVVNVIYAQFKFQDNLIIRHTDNFDIWKWSKQALGFKGLLLGWTGFMQKQIHKQALYSLDNYKKKSND
ncbi:nuclear transport factor 2 family protein [Flavobacterium taihuense]|uniref:Nuclear transport factor 2 family protein n=1 Tax=Flavobacterium taihuense TaxID=2857508 RepID=A0ABS6XZZ8_9FLAO|nr:nuclear transport factor 2 family protein [Flavobacterium taihuense]MBW4362256.1 nuclear transport factor 2 family protein [Flavobacterium taihuense]